MRFLRWIRNLMIGMRLRMRVNTILHDLEVLDDKRKAASRNLSRRKKELEELQAVLVFTQKTMDESVQNATDLLKNYQEQLEAARSKLKIMEEVTVPTLMQQNQTLLEMWKAETAIQVRRQVAYQRPSGEDM